MSRTLCRRPDLNMEHIFLFLMLYNLLFRFLIPTHGAVARQEASRPLYLHSLVQNFYDITILFYQRNARPLFLVPRLFTAITEAL